MSAKTAVVVQARMGSNRFPGKVMAELAGKPMLRFMLDRLRALEDDGIDLWVATTTDPADDVISDALCHNEVIRCFRGSQDDVLSRFRAIARDYDVVVRLTGDCPLLTAGIVRHVLELHERYGGDYTACLQADGLEVQVYEREALEQITPSQWSTEHVGPPPGECHWVNLPSLSVDTPEDLERVREFVAS
jgi:spore coat polysaccharide biosynthesis protein SpsF (cytidylyltransferase family)